VSNNRKNSLFVRFASIVLLLVLPCGFTVAAPRESRSADDAGIKRLLQQLSSERDALQSENNDLVKQLETAVKEQEKLSTKLARRESSLESFKASNHKFSDRLASVTDEKNTLLINIREKDVEKRHLEQQRLVLEENLVQLRATLNHHVENNQRLVKISNELLGYYEGKGLMAVMKNREPLTQFSKVALENFVQEYTFEIEELSIQNLSTVSPAATPTTASN